MGGDGGFGIFSLSFHASFASVYRLTVDGGLLRIREAMEKN